MDNLTHSLVGVALAEVALRDGAPASARRVFLAAGVIASNLPDIDLVYTGIAPEPLGYLMHHRGHTHTVAGLVAQGLVLAAIACIPALRRSIRDGVARRFAALVAIALCGHLVLDSWNVYGVHPFHPFDSRWFYGDAVFIFEPWIWLVLGIAAASNARSRGFRIALPSLVGVLAVGLGVVGVLPVMALVALAIAGALFAWSLRGAAAPRRSAVALAAAAAVVASLFGLSAVAEQRARRALGDSGRSVVDVIVNPNPAWPACWAVIAIEREAATDALVLRRGTLSLFAMQAPGDCPSHQIERLSAPVDAGHGVAWADEKRQDLIALRALARDDCWTRAWLQFGRAPFVSAGAIADLRFESGGRGNFTAMATAGERACPPAMTRWTPPRADVLSAP